MLVLHEPSDVVVNALYRLPKFAFVLAQHMRNRPRHLAFPEAEAEHEAGHRQARAPPDSGHEIFASGALVVARVAGLRHDPLRKRFPILFLALWHPNAANL